MKKLFVILFVVCLSMLTGCKEAAVQTPTFSEGYTANVEISYDDDTYCATIHRIGQGVWDAELTEPDTVKGMSTHYENGEVGVKYKGISVSLPDGALPMKNVLAKTFSVLDSIYTDPNIKAKSAEAGSVVIEGESEETKFIITFNADGELLSVNIPSYKLSVKVIAQTDLSKK